MADNLIVTVLGRKGSGKTTLARKISHEYERVIAFDWVGEFGTEDRFELVAGLREGADALVKASGRKRYRVSIRGLTREETYRLFAVASKLKRALLIVDEASNYCSAAFLPDEIATLVRYGRHNELSQLYIARRPSEVNRELTAQSDLVVTFQQQEPRDLEYLRALMGKVGDRARELGRYQIIAGGDLSKAPLAVLERINEKPLTASEGPD